MQCPSEVVEILADILTTGLLRIRVSVDAKRSAIEADHLHNLPALMTTTAYTNELLDYYWSVERPCFVYHSSPEDTAAFEPLWKALSAHVHLAQDEMVVTER